MPDVVRKANESAFLKRIPVEADTPVLAAYTHFPIAGVVPLDGGPGEACHGCSDPASDCPAAHREDVGDHRDG